MPTIPTDRNASSSRAFFSTPELVEAMLLQLPPRDLLIDQRVNHSWHDMISSSLAIQQKLFFQPRPKQDGEKPYLNPLLQKAFPPWFNAAGRGSHTGGKPFEALEWNRDSKTQSAYSRREASWRRMLLTQPTKTRLRVVKHSHFMRGDSTAVGEVKFPDGVRMGALYDLSEEALAKPITSFNTIWRIILPEPDDESDDEHQGIKDEIMKSTMILNLHWTKQCKSGDRPDVPVEYRSLGYKKLDIEFQTKGE